MKSSQNGFTIIELVIALTLFSIASFSFSVYTRYATLMLFRTHVTTLYTQCQTAEIRAATTRTPVTLTLNPDNHTFQIDQSPSQQMGCLLAVLPETYGPPSKPTKLVTEPVTGVKKKNGVYCLVWDQNGTTTATSIYLTSHAGHQATITLPRARAASIRLYYR